MRFLPITLDNVKNAAMMFVSIANKNPWSGEWTYSSAYARLFAIAKSSGFTGHITMDNNGLPCGFIMGTMKQRADGKNDFMLEEICYIYSDTGLMYAKKTLEYLEEQLRRQNTVRICYTEQANPDVARYFEDLSFMPIENIVAMERKL